MSPDEVIQLEDGGESIVQELKLIEKPSPNA